MSLILGNIKQLEELMSMTSIEKKLWINTKIFETNTKNVKTYDLNNKPN